jgi:hypothetical protein
MLLSAGVVDPISDDTDVLTTKFTVGSVIDPPRRQRISLEPHLEAD